MPLLSAWRQVVFGIPLSEVDLEKKGFHVGRTETRERLERVGKCVAQQFNVALQETDPHKLKFLLELLDPELQGFGYEGAAMGLGLLDLLTPGPPRRFKRFIDEVAERHLIMSHIGYGAAAGLLRRNPLKLLEPLGHPTKWMIIEGYGFASFFFRTQRFVRERQPPPLSGFHRSIFDVGAGRALWFVGGAEPDVIAALTASFPEERRPSLWTGIGVACAYAGGVSKDTMLGVMKACGAHLTSLQEGVTIAAMTRHYAGNPGRDVELASTVINGEESAALSRWAQRIFDGVATDDRGYCEGQPGWQVFVEKLRASPDMIRAA